MKCLNSEKIGKRLTDDYFTLHISITMKLVIVPLALLLSGCQLLTTAGRADYTVEPFITDSGKVICCKAVIHNSKNYSKFKFSFKTNPDGSVDLTLDEKGVSASDPARVSAENQSKLLDALTTLLPKTN